jgi:nicotinamidase-related amidase
MSVTSTDKGLLTPDNCAIIFVDHQPQMFFGVANIDRQDLLNNLLLLAKSAKIFGVPVILRHPKETANLIEEAATSVPFNQ